jgi:UDP-N-acetylglucosamine 4,6-dehydratase
MLDGKVILITGGTGSFGNHFTEYLLKNCKPAKIIIFSRDEYKQFIMKNKFKDHADVLRFFVGDVRDAGRLMRAFDGVDYVVHAAAMKQVPACEYNPIEAIKTNIHGAINIIDAALDRKVKKVVALSTDKAVNPINLYGGTKLVSDKLFISANAYSGGKNTVFSIVRYGNVAGSRGSVIPFFADLIKKNEKSLPITDFRMTRFWINLDRGIELVMNALKNSKGGETFISKIPSFKIVDLAKAMKPDCELAEIGIREGEKLHEIMITTSDAPRTYAYNDFFVIYPDMEWWKYTEDLFIPGGVKVSPEFEYNSGDNKEWIDVKQLSNLLNNYKF